MPTLSGNSHSALWRPLQGWTLTPAGSPTLPSEEGTTRRGDSPDYKGTHCSIGQVGKNILTRARDPPLCLMRWANYCVFTWVNDAWEPRSSVDSGSSTFCLHPCGDSQLSLGWLERFKNMDQILAPMLLSSGSSLRARFHPLELGSSAFRHWCRGQPHWN